MKRISIVTLATALVLLSGCNKDNELNNSVDIDFDNTTDMQLIKLGGSTGAPSVKSRASIESLDEMDVNDRMGIFCLAGRKTDVKSAQTAAAPNWNNAVLPPDDPKYAGSTNGRYWSNIRCEVQPDGGNYHIVPTELDANGKTQYYYRYYPITSLYGYDFYGYYPYQTDDKVTYSSELVSVNMTINGHEDVIYGKSEDIDAAYAASLTDDPALQKTLMASYYSARFFRKHPLMADDAHLKLEHKLARFRFFVYPGPDKEAAAVKTYDGALKLYVKELKLVDQFADLRLVVASKSDKNRNGELTALNKTMKDFTLLHKDGTLLEDDIVEFKTQVDANGVTVPDTTQLGDCIMFLPGGNKHLISVSLADINTGEVYPSEANTVISFKESTGQTFEAGKTYNVYLQVSGIKDITLSAELVEWEESGEDMDLVEFN